MQTGGIAGIYSFLAKFVLVLLAIYAADNYLTKDLAIIGDGSLTIEFQNVTSDQQGIMAENLTIASDLTIVSADCGNIANGIICDSSLILMNNANVTVNNGAAKYSTAVRAHGNVFLEEGTSLNVSVDEKSAELGECIRVTGLLDIGTGSTLTASAKKNHAIDCYGSIKINKGAFIAATSEEKDADVFCYGSVVNYDGDFQGEIEALGGIHNRD